MSRLQVFDERGGEAALRDTCDGLEIASSLAEIGVRFERWPTRSFAADATPEEILTNYAPEIERLKASGGYLSCDVIRVTPDHPDRSALRAKFAGEHTHAEDEVRFFVEGEAMFTLHSGGKVYAVTCGEGDLIAVPAGTKHWADIGEYPHFAAIRLFLSPDGWAAAFTGDPIAERFPRLERQTA